MCDSLVIKIILFSFSIAGNSSKKKPSTLDSIASYAKGFSLLLHIFVKNHFFEFFTRIIRVNCSCSQEELQVKWITRALNLLLLDEKWTLLKQFQIQSFCSYISAISLSSYQKNNSAKTECVFSSSIYLWAIFWRLLSTL